MLKKIAIIAFLSGVLLNANTDLEKTLEDKYASCEKKYDECITKCEEVEGSVEECTASCESKLYDCQSQVEEEMSIKLEDEKIVE